MCECAVVQDPVLTPTWSLAQGWLGWLAPPSGSLSCTEHCVSTHTIVLYCTMANPHLVTMAAVSQLRKPPTETNSQLAALYGIKSHAIYGNEAGPGTQEISFVKQDLQYTRVLGEYLGTAAEQDFASSIGKHRQG